MWKYDLELEKNWAPQSRNFIIGATMVLGTWIVDKYILFCYGNKIEKCDKKITIRENKGRKVLELFNDPFSDNLGNPANNVIPVAINRILQPIK